MKTMKNYHDLHLKCDVSLLADVLAEKFRNSSLKNYRLCPSHYLSAPALYWDAMFNTTKIELELDPKQESKHVICLDANNLYGFTMPKFLSTGEFK